MTCIIGISHKGKVFMGGDGYDMMHLKKHKKVFKRDKFLIGFTTSFRMGDLLQYSLNVEDQKDEDDREYMCTKFIDAVRKCFKNGGFAKKENDVEEAGNFLVGYKGNLYEIHDDYQVGENFVPYAAIGSGYAVALGHLYATQHCKNQEKRILQALEASEHFCIGVRRPFYVLSSE